MKKTLDGDHGPSVDSNSNRRRVDDETKTDDQWVSMMVASDGISGMRMTTTPSDGPKASETTA